MRPRLLKYIVNHFFNLTNAYECNVKIAISFPPIPGNKRTPLLAQNRQFQYFHEPTYIYPMVPAYAATLLKKSDYDVVWDDGIAEAKTYEEWLMGIEQMSPDIVVMETKTPLVKKHWTIIDDVKKVIPDAKNVLVGDHVTALPRESMESSKVDYVIEGGDYDFLLLNLVRCLDGKVEELEPGIWYRENKNVKSTGHFQLNHDLDNLPFIDRNLTKWWLYSEKNGNYKKIPGTYTMVGRDCWWHKCSFCSWTALYPNFRVRQPENLVEEIGLLIDRQGVKEVFDDTGTFPVGDWLQKFCNLMVERGYNEKINFNCNMRFAALSFEDYSLMKKAGFRMLLFGLESANQKTLDRINKNITAKEMVVSCKTAQEAGLEPHLTMMIGYPWETREDSMRTLSLARMLMEKGWATTLQCTIVIPYPGTQLYEESLRNGWFRIDPKDFDRFDMTEPVLTTPDMEPWEVIEICHGTYKIFLSPRYMFRHFTRIRSWRDVRYSLRGFRAVLGHIRDFARR